MAKAKTKSKKTVKKKVLLKGRQRRHISNFVKVLHALDVDVKKHAKDLGIEEVELDAYETSIEKDHTLSEPDKKQLMEILDNVKESAEKIVGIETKLYNYSKPLGEEAKIIKFVNLLRADTIQTIENTIMASVNHEEKGIFFEYPKAVALIENSCSSLIKLEKKWKVKASTLRWKFFKVHHELRRILHEDIFVVSNEILAMYNLRISIYNDLVKSSKKRAPDLTDKLNSELNALVTLANYYGNLYSAHTKKITQLYKGLAVKGGKK